jgi:hypothetical protein
MTDMERMSATEEDLEQQRLGDIAALGDDIDVTQFVPGTFGCHEAMHTASIMMDMAHDQLLQHPAVLNDPEFYRLANNAFEALFEVYQAIGTKHLAD